MNFAFPAVILFLLALPGIISRYAYRKGNWKAPITIKPVAEETAYSLVLAGIFHTLWIFILSLFGIKFDLYSLVILLIGNFGKDDIYLSRTVLSIIDHPAKIFFYFLSIYFLSAILGFLGHKFIRWTKLDKSYPFFRFNNEWYYLFSGEITGFNDNEDIREKIDFTYISAIVQQSNQTYLYRGILSEYYFDRNGDLDRIILIEAQRRLLSPTEGENNNEKYYDIRGDYLILRYSEIKNLNLEYILLKKYNPKK